ncbi:MAG TPA: hypothetical protein VFH04_04520, partial [Nitrososphaeraceae archaeon]|nr:hypothetical protein [Nitrososphaeraceae archaeon]
SRICHNKVEVTEIVNGANFDGHYLSENVSKQTAQDYNFSETCNMCGLTARNKLELDQHVNNAHSSHSGL